MKKLKERLRQADVAMLFPNRARLLCQLLVLSPDLPSVSFGLQSLVYDPGQGLLVTFVFLLTPGVCFFSLFQTHLLICSNGSARQHVLHH